MSTQIIFTKPVTEVGRDVSYDDRYVYVDGHTIIEFMPWLAPELRAKVAKTVLTHLGREPH